MGDTFLDAVFLLVRVAIIYGVYKVAKRMASESSCSRGKAYAIAIGVALLFAALSWANFGTHQEDANPLHGGGTTVVDFVPSKQERNQQGLFVFIVLGTASLAGTHSGLKIRRR